MKYCPTCQNTYEDALDTCPLDEQPLISAVEIPPNPPEAEVVPAAPDVQTADFDIVQTSDGSHSDLQQESSKRPFFRSPIFMFAIACFLVALVIWILFSYVKF